MKQKLAYIEMFGGCEPARGLPAQPAFVFRIFKNRRAAMNSRSHDVVQTHYDYAVKTLRYQLWLRCRGECEFCASPVTEQSGHMHEQKHRGKGGEISMENSVFICPTCHQHEHKDRNPQFSKKGNYIVNFPGDVNA